MEFGIGMNFLVKTKLYKFIELEYEQKYVDGTSSIINEVSSLGDFDHISKFPASQGKSAIKIETRLPKIDDIFLLPFFLLSFGYNLWGKMMFLSTYPWERST